MLSSPSIGKMKNNSIIFVCFFIRLKFIEVFGLFNSSINSFTELNDLKKSFFGWSSSNDVDNSYVLYGKISFYISIILIKSLLLINSKKYFLFSSSEIIS